MNKKKLRLLTYLAGFFLTVTVSFPAYLNSTFLKNFVSEKNISFVYAAASLLTILLTLCLPKVLSFRGILPLTLLFALISLLSLWGLTGVSFAWLVIIFFVVYYSLGFILRYLLDLYLEQISEDKDTGNIRGLALTAYNLSWLSSPLLAGVLAATGNFRPVYIFASLFFFPLILILFFLKEKKGIVYSQENLFVVFKRLITSKSEVEHDLKNILVVDFLLNIFYAVMVVYTPLYLVEKLNLSLPEMGFVFTVMLLPFVLFEYPLGKLADKVTGEKELLMAGFLLMAGSTALVSFALTDNLIIWALLLFTTRVGAATVEVMKETYLFKKIGEKDAPILSLSRLSSPVSYLIGPLLVSLFLLFFNFRFIFLTLALVVSSGLWFTSRLRDTNE